MKRTLLLVSPKESSPIGVDIIPAKMWWEGVQECQRPRAALRGEDRLVGAKGSKAGEGGVTAGCVGLIPEVMGGGGRQDSRGGDSHSQAGGGGCPSQGVLAIIQAWDTEMEFGQRGFPENQGWVPGPPPFGG